VLLRLPGGPFPGLSLPWQVSIDLVVLGRFVHILRIGLDFGVLLRLPEPQLSRESPVRLPPNPAFKTNAEIEKLNGQMETWLAR
jgi:hypothetical protein